MTQVVYIASEQPITGDHAYKRGNPGQGIYELPTSDSIATVRGRKVTEYVTTSSQSITFHNGNPYMNMSQSEPIVYDYRHGNGNAPLLLSGGIKFDANSGFHTGKSGKGRGNSVSALDDPRFDDWEND